MLKIVFLCSGGGGNLRFIAEAIRLGWLKQGVICGVITDRECLANQFARDKGIWTAVIDFSQKDQFNLLEELHRLAPDIVVTNVHKILAPGIVDAFRGRLINLHYSLLPAFGGVIGMKPIRQALDYGVQFVGTTAHLVEKAVDTGQPLVQATISVAAGDTTERLMDVVFRCGCLSLLTGIQILRADGQPIGKDKRSAFEICGRSVAFSPNVAWCSGYEDEEFWHRLKTYPQAPVSTNLGCLVA